MIKTIDSARQSAGVFIERRRPGRAKYINPHLIALLRSSAQNDLVDAAEDGYDLIPNRGQSARLGKTISLLDGASQVGIPRHVTKPEHELRAFWHGPFLANQCCYVTGTGIASRRGAMPIEDVTIGDIVMTMSGTRRVTWTGQFSLNPSEEPEPKRTTPVCVRRDAIAPGLPGQDQWVSPLHCLWVDNRLVPALLLVNHMTVTQKLLADSVTYCHLLFDKPAQGHLAGSSHLVKPIWDRLAERAEHFGFKRALPAGVGESQTG